MAIWADELDDVYSNQEPNEESIFEDILPDDLKTKKEDIHSEPVIETVDAEEIDYTYEPFYNEKKRHRAKRNDIIINLDDYPDSHEFKIGELASYMNLSPQTVRNILVYIEEIIQPIRKESGTRYFTKEHILKFESIYEMYSQNDKTWEEIALSLKAESGKIITAPDKIKSAEVMMNAMNEKLEETLKPLLSAIATQESLLNKALEALQQEKMEKELMLEDKSSEMEEIRKLMESQTQQNELLIKQNAELKEKIEKQAEDFNSKLQILQEQTQPKKKGFFRRRK